MAVVTPTAYSTAAAIAVLLAVVVCIEPQRHPGNFARITGAVIGCALLGDAVSYVVAIAVSGQFTARASLPLALCNAAVLVAAVACLWHVPELVELTYFWGLAGTLQAVITPDLSVGFPHLVFFQYVVGHFGIVLAALYLVVGCRRAPRRGAVKRAFLITCAYTAAVGLVDWWFSANYMFLARPPSNWTVLRILGPWPFYVLTAAALALGLFIALDLPFRSRRRALRSAVDHESASLGPGA